MPDDIQNMEQRIRIMQKKTKDTRKPSQVRLFVNAAFNAVTEFVSPIIIGVCLGYVFDFLFHTKPIITVVFAIFGCIAGILNLYRMGQQIERSIKD